MRRELTEKQRRFIDEYLVDLNAAAAYRRSGYSQKQSSSEVEGPKLLKNPRIRAAVQARMNARADRVEVKQDEVLREILRLGMSDIRELFDEQGRLLPIHMLPDSIGRAVASVEVVTSRIPGSDPVEVEYTSKIKLWDKKGSLELLGKHLKLFNDAPPAAAPTVVTVYMPDNGRG